MSAIDLCGRRTFEECRGSTTIGGVPFSIEIEEKPLAAAADPHELEMYTMPADCAVAARRASRMDATVVERWEGVKRLTGDAKAGRQARMVKTGNS